MHTRRLISSIAILAVGLLVALPAAAQDAKLSVCVKSPPQAYVFVDGRALGDGTRHNIKLPAGQHTVDVYNYGYKPFHTTVNLASGEKHRIDVILEPIAGTVNGPWGRIQIEGGGHHAVLLNGKNPDYLVGHADEFNHDIIWKQELIVPAGKHHVTLIRDGQSTYETDVDVAANQRVIIDVKKNSSRNTDWPRGGKLSNLPLFKAGIASATVAVHPVEILSFTATPGTVKCEESSRLAWKTDWTAETWINDEKVDLSGEKLVTPLKTTDYTLVAAGPGGRKQQSATVNVITEVQASLSLNPSEIRYRKINDRVIEHGTATLTWSTDNASKVSIDPLGDVPASGNRTVQPTPQRTEPGQWTETVNYTLNASNACGGSATRTAALKINASIEIVEIVLQSVFFPTDYPDERNPDLGLLGSQRRDLSLLAQGFKKYLEYDPQAKLTLEGNADERRSVEYNRALGQRRADIVKQFLVDAGIPSANLETTTLGEERNITRDEVKDLEAQNPNAPPKVRIRNLRGDWLANNRRVDLVLRPGSQYAKATRYYPHNADDSGILWQIPKPSRRVVEKNQ
jgi:outer membrane protein OmpA-like peptidoglycan-associated protein